MQIFLKKALRFSFWCVVAISLAFTATFLYFFIKTNQPANPPYFTEQEIEACAFCNEQILKRQLICETDHVYALANYMDIASGYALVVPKRHVERFEDLNAEETEEILLMIKKLYAASKIAFDAKGYLLVNRNGRCAHQTVPHVHIHFIPRREDQNGSFAFAVTAYFRALFYGLLSDEAISAEIHRYQEALKSSSRN